MNIAKAVAKNTLLLTSGDGNYKKFYYFTISILNGSLFPDFIKISKKYWLMATDAFHVATMKRHGITNIATTDPDFEWAEWIKVWKP